MRPDLKIRNKKKIQSEMSFFRARIDNLKKQIQALKNQLEQYEVWLEEDEKEIENL